MNGQVIKVRHACQRYNDDPIFVSRRQVLLRIESLLDPNSHSIHELKALADVTEVIY